MRTFTDNRLIVLPNGGTLEVEMSEAFLQKLREHFELKDGAAVDDDHVRMFIWGACNTAISKAEQEIANGEGS